LGLYYELGVGNALSIDYNKRSVQVRVQHIGLDESFLEKTMASQAFEVARRRISNTVRNAVQKEQINMRASLSRGNLNSLNLNMRSASLPMLIAPSLNQAAKPENSITSTVASSFGDTSSQGVQDPLQGKIVLASIDSLHQMTGIVSKLKSYYNFLKAFPDLRQKVVLFQVIRGLFFKSDNMQGAHLPEERS